MNEGYGRLQEARNTGEWLEARLHLMFTEIADGMFGDGRLTRDERIALSSAIGAGLDAFRAKVEEAAVQLYSRDPWAPVESGSNGSNGTDMTEGADGELIGAVVPLVERAVRRDGTIPVKVIGPGWGSTGYYPAAVLERDGPKVFTPGVQMFWDHATATEEAERPEGSLNDLAAVLTTPARWDGNGPEGPGLYADAKVFEAYQAAVNNLAPHIGVSIRAFGKAAQGAAEGRHGRIIQEITSASSVDFVTKPGAGGKIVEMFEAARTGHRDADLGSADQQKQEGDEGMSKELEGQLAEAQKRLAAVETQNARLQEALLLREGREFVREQLAGVTLPQMTKQRLYEALTLNPPTKDGALDKAAYVTQIQAAVTSESAYLAEAASWNTGQIQGMGAPAGAAAHPDAAEVQKRLAESFRTLGLSDKEVQHAVSGRAW